MILGMTTRQQEKVIKIVGGWMRDATNGEYGDPVQKLHDMEFASCLVMDLMGCVDVGGARVIDVIKFSQGAEVVALLRALQQGSGAVDDWITENSVATPAQGDTEVTTKEGLNDRQT